MTTNHSRNYKLKVAIIAGASAAVKYSHKNQRATPEEIIQHVTDTIEEILSKVDEEKD